MKLSVSLLLLGALLVLALGANQLHHLWVMLLGLLLFGAARRVVRAFRWGQPALASSGQSRVS